MLSPDHIARQLAPRHRAAFHSGQRAPVIREDQQRIGKAVQQSPSRIIATSIAHLSLLSDPPVRYDKPTLLQQPNSLDPYFSPTTLLRETLPVNSTTVVRTVKVLVVHTSPPSIDDAIGLMKCFPCLQKLYVLVFLDKESKRVRLHDPRDYLECLDLHLKKLVLINYRGIKRDVEFAKFFLLKARVLEMMELAIRRQSCDSKYLTKQGSKLQLKRRASKDAQVLFSCHNY
ncbi:hypothetical protein C2845_PM04G07780 [Panicum miliaceum]|uniref:FBD domain-containing protein n=1 Tax=Panicum miliaceum TaxID=4540 RepID=A0A3L6QT85_PANMI|nr:hypothetical protein C2845_PM04G07780 [Panicum miliaceum]